MQKAAEPYNLYAIRDDRWTNLVPISVGVWECALVWEAAIDSRRLALISS